MNEFRSNTETLRSRRTFVFAVTLVALGIVLLWFVGPLRGIAKTVFAQAGVPLWSAKENFFEGVETVSLSLLSKSELIERAKKLALAEERIGILALELRALKEENARLQKVSESAGASIPVKLLSRPNTSPFDTVFIAAGKNKEVKKGDLVFADDLVVLGSVDEVFPTSARVVLYSRAGLAASAFLSGSATTVLLDGVGAQNFTISLPESITTTKGDTVSLPLPYSNVVAEVIEVSANQNEPIKTVYLRSPINIFSLEWVRLVHM